MAIEVCPSGAQNRSWPAITKSAPSITPQRHLLEGARSQKPGLLGHREKNDPVVQFFETTTARRWKLSPAEADVTAAELMPYFDGTRYPNLQI